jgi:hypothetical protein
MRLICLNLKVIFSSVILYLFYAFIALFFLFFLVMMNQTRFINHAVFLDSLAYLEIAVFILAFCLAVYFAHQGYALEEVCFVSKTGCLLGRLSALLIASSFVCVVPLIIYCRRVGVGRNGAVFQLPGRLIFCFAMALPAFGISISGLSGGISAEKDLRIFAGCAVRDHIQPPERQFPFHATVAAAQKKFAPKTAAAMCSCLAVIALFCHIYISIFPKGYSYGDKLYVTADRSGGYRVASYEGDIRLSEYGDYKCLVTVEKGRGDLMFRLDGVFEIKKLTLEGRDVQYSRSGDFIFLTTLRFWRTMSSCSPGARSLIPGATRNSGIPSTAACFK